MLLRLAVFGMTLGILILGLTATGHFGAYHKPWYVAGVALIMGGALRFLRSVNPRT